MTLALAYSPPYHRKYNPIERCWGRLEQHWNGDLLESVNTVLQFARPMTWKGKHPTVELIGAFCAISLSYPQEFLLPTANIPLKH